MGARENFKASFIAKDKEDELRKAGVRAFRAHDFDGDAGWAKFLAKFEIPGEPSAAALDKLKAKYFKREVDASFDVRWLQPGGGAGPAPPPSRPAATTAVASAGAASASRPAKSSSTVPEAAASGGPPPRAGRRGFLEELLDFHTMLFLSYSLSLFLAALYLVSIPLSRFFSRRMYQMFFYLVMMISGMKTVVARPVPPFRPFSLPGWQAWFAGASGSSDFQYMFMAFILLPQRPMTMAVVSPGCLAVYHSMAFLKKKFHGTAVWEKTRLDRLHARLVRNQQSALMLNASAEIAIGFMAFMQLLSPGRSVSLVFVYWNFLKMRYNCPDAAKYHKQCWALLGQRADGYGLRRHPLVARGLSWAQAWFERGAAR